MILHIGSKMSPRLINLYNTDEYTCTKPLIHDHFLTSINLSMNKILHQL